VRDVHGACLYWADSTGRRVGKPALWRFDPRSCRQDHWRIDRDVGAMALHRGGGAALAQNDGFCFHDFASGALDPVATITDDVQRARLNDGKCDRRGRFFAGGMDDKEELGLSSLWRLNPDLSLHRLDQGLDRRKPVKTARCKAAMRDTPEACLRNHRATAMRPAYRP
jgi:L-arabinonolactonase